MDIYVIDECQFIGTCRRTLQFGDAGYAAGGFLDVHSGNQSKPYYVARRVSNREL